MKYQASALGSKDARSLERHLHLPSGQGPNSAEVRAFVAGLTAEEQDGLTNEEAMERAHERLRDQQPRDQWLVTSAEADKDKEFYIIGDPRAGKGYHGPNCGQVREWQRSLPSNLKLMKLPLIQSYRMKPCKQCK